MQEASSPEEEGFEEVCLINTLVEEHCDKNLEESLNESLEVLEDGLPEPSDVLAIMSPWRRREEILPLFNKEDSQGVAVEDPPKLVLKPLPVDLKYAYLEEDEKCPVVVSSTLTSDQEDSLLGVLRKCKKAIGWQISDLKGISPLVCTHHIYMEEDAKPVRQPQRRQLVGEPTQVVPKKSGITVIQNEKGEEVSTRPTSGWRVCIDYGGYFQIEIDLEDQEKTTFTCPFGTFAIGDALWSICSPRCIEKDLVLNWEKCHFMVQQGIVLGHIISKNGIEVDKAKVELIVKLPPPTNVKGIRQFLGHAGFYRREDGKPYVIYYASKTLNEAQRNYTTTEKELLAVVFALDKFRAYLVGSSIVVFTDHSALKYLLTKQDAKARLIRWIFCSKNSISKSGIKRGVSHVNRGSSMVFSHCKFLVTGEVPNQIIRKCVPEQEQSGILPIAMIVHVEDAHSMCKGCDRCQRLGKLTRRNMMPLNPILIVDVFDVWGIDFMGPFPMSFGHSYILVGVDYVSKWVEAIPCRSNDHKVVLKFLKDNIFARFGVPKAIISDGGTHFCNKPFETLLAKYGVKHKVATPYHPQTSGQVELANREIKNILMKVVNVNRKDWSIKLLDSLWAYRTAYKTILECLLIALFMAKRVIFQWRLNIKHGKLKSRWTGPFIIHEVHPNGVVEVFNPTGNQTFKVNGHRLKPFIEPYSKTRRRSTSLNHTTLRESRKKIKKNVEKPSKARQGAKQREQSTAIQGAKIFAPCETLLAHECHFAHLKAIFAPCESRCENFAHLNQGAKFIPRREAEKNQPAHQLRALELTNSHLAPFRPWQRLGGLSASPSSPMPRPEQSAIGGATSPPAQDSTVPHLRWNAFSRRYPTRRPPTDPVPPAAKPRGLLLGHLRRGPSSGSWRAIPDTSGRAAYRGLSDSVGIPLETVIRRPMIAGPPIEGNLDCRDRSFHSETCLMSRLSDSSQSSGIHSVCCRVYDYSRVRNPTLIHFTIDGRQGAIGARHIAEALRIPYEPVTQADFREWSSFSQRDMVRILSRGTSTASVLTRRELPSGMLLIDVLLRANIFPLQHKVQRRGAILEALFRISEGYYFGPHHLIMTSLLHFEEKVHQKKLQRADGAPAVPPPQEAPDVPPPPELPQDEQLPQAQQDEILTDTTPPAPTAHTSVHMPEATLPASPITQPAPPRLSALIADTEHCSGFSYPADGHYSCTPGSDHCYSDPAYHDPSSDPAASEYADTLGMIGLDHPSLQCQMRRSYQ
ncbi:Pol polyprotein [Vitis vinifera]|uniref:Pol polyprotein n=1 Tax=Vitis vinifera TaxID=29760 RepID=A0A438DWN7_VITVI|nr:Pol polyprotein [Vitis vinifera]